MNGLSEKLRDFLIKEPIILEHMSEDIADILRKLENSEKLLNNIATEMRSKYGKSVIKSQEILNEIELLKQNEKFQTKHIEEQGKTTIDIKNIVMKILSYVIIIAGALGIGIRFG